MILFDYSVEFKLSKTPLFFYSMAAIKNIHIGIFYQPKVFAQLAKVPFSLYPPPQIAEHCGNRHIGFRTHMFFPLQAAGTQELFHLCRLNKHLPNMRVGWHECPALPLLPNLNGNQFADESSVDCVIDKDAIRLKHP